MTRLVCGVGINDGTRPVKIDGKKTKEYSLWNAMLRRCYSSKSLINSPTYKKCTVSENFKNYTYFYDWCQKQNGFNVDGFELDKDLAVKGNTVYSEDLCVFIPSQINSLLSDVKSRRGDFPLGISYIKSKKLYYARMQTETGRKSLGRRKTIAEAFALYKNAKEEHVKNMANKYKDIIDARVYNTLINHVVTIED